MVYCYFILCKTKWPCHVCVYLYVRGESGLFPCTCAPHCSRAACFCSFLQKNVVCPVIERISSHLGIVSGCRCPCKQEIQVRMSTCKSAEPCLSGLPLLSPVIGLSAARVSDSLSRFILSVFPNTCKSPIKPFGWQGYLAWFTCVRRTNKTFTVCNLISRTVRLVTAALFPMHVESGSTNMAEFFLLCQSVEREVSESTLGGDWRVSVWIEPVRSFPPIERCDAVSHRTLSIRIQ